MVWRQRSKRILGGGVAAVVVLLGATILGSMLLGAAAIEAWVDAQLKDLALAYLGPELRIARVTYHRPRTIVLDGVILSSPDPAAPGQHVAVVTVRRVWLTLTEIPRSGTPLRFSEIILESPELRLIALGPEGKGVIGLAGFIKDSGASSATAQAAAAAPMKFSDLLHIRHLEIVDGAVSYDPRTPGSDPIWLDKFNVRLDLRPDAVAAGTAPYRVATSIARRPAFALELLGHVDFDRWTVELEKADLRLDLRRQNAHDLPPGIQGLLASHAITGQLHVTAKGNLPLTRWQHSTLQSAGELTGARAAAGDTTLSVGSWTWEVDVAEGVATIRRAEARLLGGALSLHGSLPLDATRPAHLVLDASSLQIQQLLREPEVGGLPLYAGTVAAHVTFAAPLGAWDTQASGHGRFSVREGRIDNLPVFGRLVSSLNNTLATMRGGASHDLDDVVGGSFTFIGDGVRLDRFVSASGAQGLRGTGTIGFDEVLDLRLKGGPMERMQDALESVGELWAALSDSMAGYRVRGTLDAPLVAMELDAPSRKRRHSRALIRLRWGP